MSIFNIILSGGKEYEVYHPTQVTAYTSSWSAVTLSGIKQRPNGIIMISGNVRLLILMNSSSTFYRQWGYAGSTSALIVAPIYQEYSETNKNISFGTGYSNTMSTSPSDYYIF